MDALSIVECTMILDLGFNSLPNVDADSRDVSKVIDNQPVYRKWLCFIQFVTLLTVLWTDLPF